MTRYPTLLRVLALGGVALALSACISLLPKSKPAHLYRFGQAGALDVTTAPMGEIGVIRADGAFQREAAGDRLLTISGGKAAFVADTRWVAPAAVLWDAAVLAAFDADPGPTRLISRGEPARSAYVLRLDVRNFEARYDQGPNRSPTVVIRIRAALSHAADQTLVSEKIIEKRVPAAENRVSAIVAAYDKAVAEALDELVAWTNDQAKPVPT